VIEWLDEAAARAAGGIKWAAVAPDTLALWVAEMDVAPPPEVTAALHDAIDRHGVLYPPLERIGHLREGIADWHADRLGHPIDAERVLFTGDVLAGLVFTLSTRLEPGSGVILPTPSYPPFFDAVEQARCRGVRVPMTREGRRHRLDLDRIESAFADGARAIVVTNPHNPTGSAPSTDELAGVADLAERHDALIISDEVHAPLTLPGRTTSPFSVAVPDAAPRLVTLSSGSKAYNLPGLRFAWLATHDDAMSEALAARPFHERGAWSNLGQVAAAAALGSDPAWLDELVADIADRLAMVVEALGPHVGVEAISDPDASFLSWVDLRDTPIDADPAGAIAETGVRVERGPRFGAEGEGFVRINVATSKDTLTRALDRIVGVL
jgi:cystathionine beta-lyase